MPSPVVIAKKTLKELQKEILTAAADLSKVDSSRNQKVSEVEALKNEVISLEQRKASLTQELGSKVHELASTEETKRETARVSQVMSDQIETSTAFRALVKEDTDQLRGDLVALEECRDMTADLFESEVEQYSLIRKKKEEAILEIASLQGKLSAISEMVQKMETKRDAVLGAIEDALVNFRRFEKRMNLFSRDTGYTIGYKDPSSLLKDKE